MWRRPGQNIAKGFVNGKPRRRTSPSEVDMLNKMCAKKGEVKMKIAVDVTISLPMKKWLFQIFEIKNEVLDFGTYDAILVLTTHLW